MTTRAQTSTEYLVIVAVVIAIAIIVISVMGGIPSIGIGTSDRAVEAQLKTANIATDNWVVSNESTILYLRNNNAFRVSVDSIGVNDSSCDATLPLELGVGASATVTCTNINSSDSGSTYSFAYNITWTNLETQNSFTITDSVLVGKVSAGSSVVVVNLAPASTLSVPADGFANDHFDTLDVVFNCSATDDVGLSNVSLYITNNLNASFVFNQTTALSGTSDSAEWTVSMLVGNYTWNCLTVDTIDQEDWDVNRSMMTDACLPLDDICSSTCDALFISSVTAWVDSGSYCKGDSAAFDVGADAYCDATWSNFPNDYGGPCADVYNGSAAYGCPSYERNGNVSVTDSDCCEYSDSCGGEDFSLFFDIDHEFFAGP